MFDRKMKVDWKKGIPRSALLGKWRAILYILQNFLTYKGWYSLTFVYHFRLLLHFEFRKHINFPYYLLRSLEKMKKGVQNGNASQDEYRLYHHRLIAILVKKELEAKDIA